MQPCRILPNTLKDMLYHYHSFLGMSVYEFNLEFNVGYCNN